MKNIDEHTLSDDVVDVMRKYVQVTDEKDDQIFKLTLELNRYKAETVRLRKVENRCLELEKLYSDNARDVKVLGASLKVLNDQLSTYETFMEDIQRELAKGNTEELFHYTHDIIPFFPFQKSLGSKPPSTVSSNTSISNTSISVESVPIYGRIINAQDLGENNFPKGVTSLDGPKMSTSECIHIIQTMVNNISALQKVHVAMCTRATVCFSEMKDTMIVMATDARQLLEDQIYTELCLIHEQIKHEMLAGESMIRTREALSLFMPLKQPTEICCHSNCEDSYNELLFPPVESCPDSLSRNISQTHSHNNIPPISISRLPTEVISVINVSDSRVAIPMALYAVEVIAKHYASLLTVLNETNTSLHITAADRDHWCVTSQEQSIRLDIQTSVLQWLASSAFAIIEDIGNEYISLHCTVFATGKKGNPFLSAAAVMGQERSNNESLLYINNTLLKHAESLQKVQIRTTKEAQTKYAMERAAIEELANTRLVQVNECRNKLSSSIQRENTLKKKISDIEKDIQNREKVNESKIQEAMKNATMIEKKNNELMSELVSSKREISRLKSSLKEKSSDIESIQNDLDNMTKDAKSKDDTIRELVSGLRDAKESLVLLEKKANSDREDLINMFEVSFKKKEENLIYAHVRALTEKEANILSRDKLLSRQQEENAVLQSSLDEMRRIDENRIAELTRIKSASEMISKSSTVETTMLQRQITEMMNEIQRLQTELTKSKKMLELKRPSVEREDEYNDICRLTDDGLMSKEALNTTKKIRVLEDKITILTRQNEVLLRACELGANQSAELREALYRSQNSSVNSSVKYDDQLQVAGINQTIQSNKLSSSASPLSSVNLSRMNTLCNKNKH